MTNEVAGPEFWQRADSIIAAANTQCDSAPPSQVAGSLLFAAARFNAFLVANQLGETETMKQERDRAVEYFTDQFKKMLNDNFDDYIANFDKYKPTK